MSFTASTRFAASSFSIFQLSLMQNDELPLVDLLDEAHFEEARFEEARFEQALEERPANRQSACVNARCVREVPDFPQTMSSDGSLNQILYASSQKSLD